MSIWNDYPGDYRAAEVQLILRATQAGECVSVVGLSGAGKSNLLGFLAHRKSTDQNPLILVDCNRLLEQTAPSLFQMITRNLGDRVIPGAKNSSDKLEALDQAIGLYLRRAGTLSLLFDRFEIFTSSPNQPLFNAMRALRDNHKFKLTFVTATRRPLPPDSELAELFHANVLWLGALSESDARWSVTGYAQRKGLEWDEATVAALIAKSWGYPSMLRASCEALAAGSSLEALPNHPAVQARVAEFWHDEPGEVELRQSGLWGHPMLTEKRLPTVADKDLTAKERLLYDFLQAHPNVVCDKDELIRAVWPEDAIFERGVRDSSLAQLVRRLRLKIEPRPDTPQIIQTVPGRGYLYKPLS